MGGRHGDVGHRVDRDLERAGAAPGKRERAGLGAQRGHPATAVAHAPGALGLPHPAEDLDASRGVGAVRIAEEVAGHRARPGLATSSRGTGWTSSVTVWIMPVAAVGSLIVEKPTNAVGFSTINAGRVGPRPSSLSPWRRVRRLGHRCRCPIARRCSSTPASSSSRPGRALTTRGPRSRSRAGATRSAQRRAAAGPQRPRQSPRRGGRDPRRVARPGATALLRLHRLLGPGDRRARRRAHGLPRRQRRGQRRRSRPARGPDRALGGRVRRLLGHGHRACSRPAARSRT